MGFVVMSLTLLIISSIGSKTSYCETLESTREPMNRIMQTATVVTIPRMAAVSVNFLRSCTAIEATPVTGSS